MRRLVVFHCRRALSEDAFENRYVRLFIPLLKSYFFNQVCNENSLVKYNAHLSRRST